MKSKKRKGYSLFSVTVLALFSFTALAPIALVLLNSTKKSADIVRNPLALPNTIRVANYIDAWNSAKMANGFKNSIILTGLTVVIVVIASTLAGYALSDRQTKTANGIKLYFMIAMTVPIQLFLFPLYSILSQLNLISNYFAIAFVLTAINMPLAVFLMRTYFLNIPKSIEEAGRIDGASTVSMFTRLMLPIVSPGMITVATIVWLYTWNEFLLTSTFMQGQDNFTVTLSYRALNNTSPDYGLLMAGAIIIIVPIIMFFIIIQRYFIEGLVSGSVKG